MVLARVRAFGAALCALATAAHAATKGTAEATNSTAGSASESLVQPSTPIISFFWNTANDSDLVLEQCQGLRLMMDPNAGKSPVAPYYFTAAPVGFQVETMEVHANFSQWFEWIPRYPVGTAITFAMFDSANQSGGSVDGYTVASGPSNCTILSAPTAPLNVSYNPAEHPCSEIDISVYGGVAPYTFSFLAGASGLYSNATSENAAPTTSRIQNPIPAGQQFTVFVTDSAGNSSVVSPTMTSEVGLSNCNRPTPTATSSEGSGGASGLSLGGIIGGVLGGVFLALFLLAGVLWCMKKRKAEEFAREQELDANTEYLKKDGTAPLVVPFVLPGRAEDSPVGSVYANPFNQPEGEGTWDSHQTSVYNSTPYSRRPSSFGTPSPTGEHPYAYPPPSGPESAFEQPSSARQRSFTANTGPSEFQYDPMAAEPLPREFDPQDPLSAHRYSDPYGSPEHDFGQATSVDGLAHPETFAYR